MIKVTSEDLAEMARRDGLTDSSQLDTVLAVKRRDYYAASIRAYRAGVEAASSSAVAAARGRASWRAFSSGVIVGGLLGAVVTGALVTLLR